MGGRYMQGEELRRHATSYVTGRVSVNDKVAKTLIRDLLEQDDAKNREIKALEIALRGAVGDDNVKDMDSDCNHQ